MNLTEAVKAAGVVGAGGAGFPTHVKLSAKAECFLVNAAECEPLIETDKYLCRTFPDRVVAAAVAVAGRQRTENWSWELGGSVSWSHSRTQTQARYPLLNLIPSDYRQRASELTEEGSSSHGFGYTARALVERRVTSNWFVGAAVDIQQAKDYTPSHALLYVRYSAAGWQGDLDMPPQPLVPYADW